MADSVYEGSKNLEVGKACGPCQKDGVKRSAVFHCTMCLDNYWANCKHQHGLFRQLASHVVEPLEEHVYTTLSAGERFDVVTIHLEHQSKRGFGKTDNTFAVVVGRASPTREGVWKFNSREQNAIIRTIEENIKIKVK